MSHVEVGRYDGVLGTVLTVRVAATDEPSARAGERAALDEVLRLQAVFSVYDPASDLCRWRSGLSVDTASALLPLVARAETWRRRSGGAFHPGAGTLVDRWRQAELDDELPSTDELAVLVAHLRSVEPPTSDYSLNAIAKGAIVDAAMAAAVAVAGVEQVVVNAGGDLAHRGPDPVVVGVENPLRPYDNEPPLTRLMVADGAVATSGRARRGFRVGGRWYGHVLDPRTGWPVESVASVSVLARTAEDADAVATVVGVLGPDDGLAIAADVTGDQGIGCLVVDAVGDEWRNDVWRAAEQRVS